MWDLAERLSQNGIATRDWSSALILSENDRNLVTKLVADIANMLNLIKDDMFCDILLHFIVNHIAENEPENFEDVRLVAYQAANVIRFIINNNSYQKSTLNWQNIF